MGSPMITINGYKKKEIQNARSKKNREIAYQTESDALFMKWQRGEIEKQVWLDKVEEIRNRFPYD